MLSRRSFFTGLATSLIGAPAIVRAGSLMPVRVLEPQLTRFLGFDIVYGVYVDRIIGASTAVAERICNPPIMLNDDGDFVCMSTRADEDMLSDILSVKPIW